MNLDNKRGFSRKGIGSSLLREFGKVAKAKGYKKIDVGSADDPKVEHFYLKNGFQPYQLVCKGPNGEEYKRVHIVNYESGKVRQEELRKQYRPKKVILLFMALQDSERASPLILQIMRLPLY